MSHVQSEEEGAVEEKVKGCGMYGEGKRDIESSRVSEKETFTLRRLVNTRP